MYAINVVNEKGEIFLLIDFFHIIFRLYMTDGERHVRKSILKKVKGNCSMSHFTVLVTLDDASDSIDEIMEPFWELTDDPRYLEFQNVEEDCRKKYETEGTDCVRLSNGTICPKFDSEFSNLYIVKDGIVYKRNFGQLHHEKRTKKAKKIQFLPNYPYKKLYRSFKEFIEDFIGCRYYETEGAYGYYTNPNSFWDWYQVGGRWSYPFLVKENYNAPIQNEFSWVLDSVPPESPEGYKWVSAAKKGAIEWKLMKQIKMAEETKRFSMYQEAYNSQSLEKLKSPFLSITDEGIANFGETVYYKDETRENYLSRHNLSDEDKYVFIPYGFVQDGTYHSIGNMAISTDENEEAVWSKEVNDYFDSLYDSQIIVLLDCHV